MLALKLSLPFSRRIFNVRTLAKASCPSEKSSCNTEGSFKNQTKVGNRCFEYKRALEKCPKESFVKRCRNKFSSDNVSQPKCRWSNADDYRSAYKAIKIRSEKMMKLVEISAKAIEQEIRSDMEKIRCDENSFTKRILQNVEPKILELSILDPFCAMKKKNDVFTLNDRTHRELMSHHCQSQMEIKWIKCELEKLILELKSRADCALDLVYSCRKSQSPQDLIDCVEHTSREAAKILDDVKVDFENRINEVKIVKEETIREDKKMVREVTKTYDKKMAKLLTGIVDCIRARKLDR